VVPEQRLAVTQKSEQGQLPQRPEYGAGYEPLILGQSRIVVVLLGLILVLGFLVVWLALR